MKTFLIFLFSVFIIVLLLLGGLVYFCQIGFDKKADIEVLRNRGEPVISDVKDPCYTVRFKDLWIYQDPVSKKYGVSRCQKILLKNLDMIHFLEERGVALVTVKNKMGLWNCKNLKFMLPIEYDAISYLPPKFFKLKKDKKIGLWTSIDGFIFSCAYRNIRDFYNDGSIFIFSNYPFAPMNAQDGWIVSDSEGFFLTDLKGNSYFHSHVKERERGFYGDLYRFGNKYVTSKGEILKGTDSSPWLSFYSDSSGTRGYNGKKFAVITKEQTPSYVLDWIGPFYDGYAVFKKDSVYGIIDEQDKIHLSFHGSLIPISLKVFIIRTNNKLGVIYKSRITILPQYDFIQPIGSHDVLCVRKNEKFGVINIDGEILLDSIYKKIDFCDNMLVIFDGKRYGFYNLDKRILTPCKYTKIEEFRDGIAIYENKFRGGISEIGIVFKDGQRKPYRRYLNE